ncbi:MAG: DNA-binding protein WhiA [Oscillospiraceae bacterium]|nr:DNA-binding protein WhiA [Oscillospiraceae bacterium]
MSFSSEAKAEMCRELPGKKCCCVAESYGVLLFCNTFTRREIRIITESREFAARLPRLFRRAFGVQFDIVPQPEDTGKLSLIIYKDEKLRRIRGFFGYGDEDMLAHHINFGILEEDCCRVSFLRGAFLAGGSVTDPAKRYHLEIVTDHYNVSRELYSLMLDMGLYPKDAARGGNYMIYFKPSAAIEDLLTMMGAPVSAMEIMSAKIEKGVRSSVNRRVNCEAANVIKAVDASQQQLAAIRAIDRREGIVALPEKLRETARMRMENPELTLTELAALFDPPITKSCLNHRLRKLVALAEEGHDR